MGHKWYLNSYVVGCFATIGGALFGFDISSMSGVLTNPSYLKQFGNPGGNLQGGITASMPAGSFAGALANTYIVDKLGRKHTIQFGGSLFVIGAILQCASQNVPMLIVGRVISGISIGICSATVPIYISEMVKPQIRGRIVSVQQWAITWGIMIQYFIQFGCSYIDGVASWRIPWGVQMTPAIVLIIGMIPLPESPRWLMERDREEEALGVLADVHAQGDKNNDLVKLEFTEIKEQIEFERNHGARSYAELFQKGIRRRVFLGCSLQIWSQLTGMNVMMYYVVYVFQAAGLTGRRANLIASSVQYVLNVVFTIPALIWLDKWGRRPTLIAGAFFMALFLFLVGGLMGGNGHVEVIDGTNTWIVSGNNNLTNGILVCSYFFVCSFAISWGPCSWTYPSEIFPMRVRGKAVSLSTASNWAFNFALAWFGPPAMENIYWKTYMLFGTFNVAALIHIFFCFPETKQRTLEEVEEIFASGHYFTAWKIKSDVGKRTIADIENSEKKTGSFPAQVESQPTS